MATQLKVVLLIIFSCFLSQGIFAEETPKKSIDKDGLPEFTLPEITVTGDNSMHALKMEVIRAEELKFELFNSLNSTDDFDIICKWYSPLGTRIKKWGCDVAFLMNAGAEDADAMMSGYGYFTAGSTEQDTARGASFVTRAQREVELAWRIKALNKEMIALAAEHPELAIAMVRANTLQQYYEAEGRKRYKKNILVGNSIPDENNFILNEIDILESAYLDHQRGLMPSEVWGRWDRLYRKAFNLKSYRIFWSSSHKNIRYADGFVTYVNSIITKK